MCVLAGECDQISVGQFYVFYERLLFMQGCRYDYKLPGKFSQLAGRESASEFLFLANFYFLFPYESNQGHAIQGEIFSPKF